MQLLGSKEFESALIDALPRAFAGKFCVALSGGIDSVALLNLLREVAARHSDWRIRAIHIDHQLQERSADWATQCAKLAESLDVPIQIERVVIDRSSPLGLEAAARAARYAVFRRELDHGEILLTGHHADDQVETLLLALLRGSGVQGLASMPATKVFGRGWHMRPLLQFTREAIASWAAERSLSYVDDPSNTALGHDRNYLRHKVIPLLRDRWPGVSAAMGRSAAHCGDALGLLDAMAVDDSNRCAEGRCLKIDALKLLTPQRRANLLRFWLRMQGLPLPSTRKLNGLVRDLLVAESQRVPVVRWRGVALHWHRQLIYAEVDSETAPSEAFKTFEQTWDWRSPLMLPFGLGELRLEPSLDGGLSPTRLPPQLTVRFRRGGEKIRLPGREHRHMVRNLLQESNVLPWWRDRIPFVSVAKQIVAVGDLYTSADFAPEPGEARLKLNWVQSPNYLGVDQTSGADSDLA